MWPWRLFGRRRGFFVGLVQVSLALRHVSATQVFLWQKKKPFLKTMTKNGKIAVFIRSFISFTEEMLVK